LAALVLRDNFLHRRAIEQAYLLAIRQAHQDITLAMAYFIPSQKILAELFHASQRGVRVNLLLQGRVEYRLQHYAAQSLYGALLTHGIRIFEYRPGFMHAKAAVIDGIWSTVGSANLDPFSLLVAREANIVVRDPRFASTLQSQLDLAIRSHSTEITADAWLKQPNRHRLLRGFCALLLYRGLRLTGYADNY
jgi:cardiolipin synthase